MRYRLTTDLPLQLDVAEGVYVLDLVADDKRGDCWLRAAERDEPVVFLLAHFRDPAEAKTRLNQGFDIPNQSFPVRIMQRLVARDGAQLIPRSSRDPIRTQRGWVPGPMADRELAEI